MNEREWRLRRRIDTLTDERDEARAKLAALRLRLTYWRERAQRLHRSRDHWRLRAVGRIRGWK